MSYEKRIAFLMDTHRMLNKEIDRMSKSGAFDDAEITEMKKKRLQLKEELVKLQEQHNAN
jgi:hypothetical protein